MKKLLLLLLIAPVLGFGQYVFNTKEDLLSTIDIYIENKSAGIRDFGDINTWDVSNITNMNGLFSDRKTFNEDISNWDVSNVKSMSHMFYGATLFNQDIGGWDTSNVLYMESMFKKNTFNQDISNWDVSNVKSMQQMFSNNHDFNQDISSWNVSSVTNMSVMFAVSSFNQDISSWDVSNVKDMGSMFAYTDNFNIDISAWDVSNVTDMRNMFISADSFNQDISSWCVTNIASEPENFSKHSPLIESNKPVWGTCPTASVDNQNQFDIIIYPNPTTSIVTLQGGKQYDIEVYNLQGKKVMALTGNTIDMSHLSSATYIVKALDKVENEEVSYKVVKN